MLLRVSIAHPPSLLLRKWVLRIASVGFAPRSRIAILRLRSNWKYPGLDNSADCGFGADNPGRDARGNWLERPSGTWGCASSLCALSVLHRPGYFGIVSLGPRGASALPASGLAPGRGTACRDRWCRRSAPAGDRWRCGCSPSSSRSAAPPWPRPPSPSVARDPPARA